MITRDRLLEILEYDAAIGHFRWKERPKLKCFLVGQVAGAFTRGYRYISIDGRRYLEHRVVWLLFTGEWPRYQIDHKNLLRDDNRFENLREATNQQNMANQGARSSSKTGIKGVSLCRQTNRWRAQLTVNGKPVNIGRFATIEQAHQAYLAAATEHFGEFARGAA